MLLHQRRADNDTSEGQALHTKWKEVHKVTKREYIHPRVALVVVKLQTAMLTGSPTIEYTKEGDDDYADPDAEVL